MMNFTQFLKAVDQAAAAMSKEQLAEFIHDTARTLPENHREDFLAEMLLFAGGKETHICPELSKADQEAAADFEQKRSFLRTRLERMESGELCLEGSLNPEYDDWYSSAEEEFLYSDSEGILDIIEEACRFVHQCVDCEEYQAACELTGILIGLDIMVGGEYQEYTDEPININDLKSYHLGNVDYRTLVIDAARAAYCASALSERADELYITLMNSGRRDITLEMILQGGRELPDIDAFLPLWIEHLGRMTGSSAGKLLQEALELADDGEQLLANAMRRLYRRAGRSQGIRRRAKRKTGYHGEVHGSIQPPERFSPGNAGIRDAGHQEKEIKFVALLHLCRTGWGVRGVQTEAAVEAVGRVPGMTL